MSSLYPQFAGFQVDEVVNGEGFGATVYFQGCSHHCKGCHNPKTWEFGRGKYTDIDIYQLIHDYFSTNPLAERLTFSGGDPLDNPHDTWKLAMYMNEFYPKVKLWLYTGYVYEDLPEDKKAICKMFDVIVDGPFILELRDITLPFRGSSNQKIIKNARD